MAHSFSTRIDQERLRTVEISAPPLHYPPVATAGRLGDCADAARLARLRELPRPMRALVKEKPELGLWLRGQPVPQVGLDRRTAEMRDMRDSLGRLPVRHRSPPATNVGCAAITHVSSAKIGM